MMQPFKVAQNLAFCVGTPRGCERSDPPLEYSALIEVPDNQPDRFAR